MNMYVLTFDSFGVSELLGGNGGGELMGVFMTAAYIGSDDIDETDGEYMKSNGSYVIYIDSFLSTKINNIN